ncbi:hypothetical protein TanjilG_06914 [Lupinus angustifolius]|uniref:WRC domain-containing protein n=1 Tax=Lupinus angustifolius TaxID=3871 RepID=A0A4P1QV44_LUPAN|nr:PREDICTED: uncharacterized protein LOC109330238 [Lupinus angustifolius]XP_019419895.1 PREDICTED: uncharacterized protein LOC109330238 [Lupinus angustifolius]OIV95452.1 hypothetical protein TanjilG_06914 [Lupinus angustifolius]
MRIRKNQGLFPSYLSSTVPISDPNLVNRSPVMVQLNDVTTTTPHHDSPASVQAPSNWDHYQPFDQILPTIGEKTNGYDLSGIGECGPHRQHNKQQPLDEDERKQESSDSKEKGNSHFRKGVILGSEIVAHEVLPPSSLSSTQDGRWCDGEKAIPLKKRRGSFENNGNSNKKMKAKMKTKMNKKCSTRNDDNEDDIDWVDEEDKSRETKKLDRVNNNVGKKKAKGSAVMEGSRCSRVNGRGWRCCQQTLVGYSLCEHHLGKGRLRSMTSVRNRSIASTTESDHKNVHDNMCEPISAASSIPEKKTKCISVSDDYPLVSDDEKKSVIVTKRRMKLGMVKARSISSLLGQTKNNVVVHEDNE